MKLSEKDMLLYAVTDRKNLHGRTLPEAVREACLGGITFLQLREKELEGPAKYGLALSLKSIAEEFHIPFVINDDVELAKEIGADGVHLGQKDMSPAKARSILGPDKIIGVTAHNAAEAKKAEQDGADYLGCGALFPTSTKDHTTRITPEEFLAIREAVFLPAVAIGGISLKNAASVGEYHADGIAAASAIFGAEDIVSSCRKLLAAAGSWK